MTTEAIPQFAIVSASYIVGGLVAAKRILPSEGEKFARDAAKAIAREYREQQEREASDDD